MVTIDNCIEGKQSKVRVIFTMSARESWGRLYLVGTFNGCNESVYCMDCAQDGSWSLTLELEAGREYQYRFRALDGRWITDPTPFLVPVPLAMETSFVSTPIVPTFVV